MQPTRAAVVSSLLGALLCLGTAAAPAHAASDDICPGAEKLEKVYLLGSSTMGSVLGPMLQVRLDKELGVRAKRWGKASSGLARPDYHDWPKLTPGLMNKHKPQVVVISLGTNDNQPIFKKAGSWVKTDNPRWKDEYAARVRAMLEKVAGEDRERSIIWLGPTRFDARNSRTLGPVVSAAIREEIEAFDGRAIYVDAFAATTDARRRPITTFKQPGVREPQPARTSDGIHLTTDAVRWLLAEPVLQLLTPCVKPPDLEAREEPAPAAAPTETAEAPPTAAGEAAAEAETAAPEGDGDAESAGGDAESADGDAESADGDAESAEAEPTPAPGG